jgi:hypothetical protein
MDSQFFLLQILLAVFDILIMCSFQGEDHLQGIKMFISIFLIMLRSLHEVEHVMLDVYQCMLVPV